MSRTHDVTVLGQGLRAVALPLVFAHHYNIRCGAHRAERKLTRAIGPRTGIGNIPDRPSRFDPCKTVDDGLDVSVVADP